MTKFPLNSLQVFCTGHSRAGIKGMHEQAWLVRFFLRGLTRLGLHYSVRHLDDFIRTMVPFFYLVPMGMRLLSSEVLADSCRSAGIEANSSHLYQPFRTNNTFDRTWFFLFHAASSWTEVGQGQELA